VDRGALFTIRLPATSGLTTAAMEAQGGPAPIPVSPGGRRILVVDDDTAIARLMARLLESRGYDVATEHSATEAAQRIAGEKFDAILTDIRMPGSWDGVRLHQWLLKEHPDLARRSGFISGELVSDEVRDFLAESGRPVLSKPFEISEFLSFVACLFQEAPG
jgi:CheY-like chemotaxis protein